MIRYKIIVTNTGNRETKERPKADPSKPDYNEFVLARALKASQYKLNERVKVRRGHKKGNVIHIETDVNKVTWDKKIPKFITVKFDDGSEYLAHYSQIKRSKV